MINESQLNLLISNYKSGFEKRWPAESFKWRAVRKFQDTWNPNAEDFVEMFLEATSKADVLLSGAMNYPRKMIEIYGKAEPDTVRQMFADLFNESMPVGERISKFQSEADGVCSRVTPKMQHYQGPMTVTVYLTFRYPEKYFFFKYSVFRSLGKFLQFDGAFKKGHNAANFAEAKRLIEEIISVIRQDDELTQLVSGCMGSDCYEEKNFYLLAFDMGFYLYKYCDGKIEPPAPVPDDPGDEIQPDDEGNGDVQIPDENPVQDKVLPSYTKEDFLSEVYMDENEYDALVNLLMHKCNVILQGAPGVGKTFTAKRLAYSILGVKDEDKIQLVQFHQNYSYEDFIMGYKPCENGFELRSGIFYDFCKKAEADAAHKYFFIIDEINRGNLSKIFGELLMLIEKDYRGTSAVLAYNNESFSVPKNLYIIGMMNTADRSLAMIDYALRRRFSFFGMEPGFLSQGFRKYQKSLANETFDELINEIIKLNLEIEQDNSLGKGFCIGHSYFCNLRDTTDESAADDLNDEMRSIVEYDILPMLEEYWFDDKEKQENWRKELTGVFSDS